jgi:PIN domain nuclease of toxin-antitoxin system
VRLLLDTHVLLWALASPSKLPVRFRRELDAALVFVSAASIWEVAIKAALGKLEADPAEVLDAVEPAGFELLPVSGAHAARVATLPLLHRDPFDRLLVAQALCEPLVLVTNDRAVLPYGDFVRMP